MNYPDGKIVAEQPETKQLDELLKSISPKVLIVPHRGEGWSDHVQAANIVKDMVADKAVDIYEYCVWMWYYNVWELDYKNARIQKMTHVTQQRKLQAIEHYLAPKAPCGEPWSGILPKPLLKAARWNKELYFKSREQ